MSDSPSPRRFFSGTTLERAILEAAGYYGIQPEELAYERQEGGLASRGKTVIKVDPDAVTKAADAPAESEAVDGGEEPASAAAVAEEAAPEADEPADVGEAAESDEAAEEGEPEEPEAPEEETEASAEADSAAAGEDAETETTDTEPTEAGDAEVAADEPETEAEAPAAESDAEPTAAVASGEMSDLPRSAVEARRGWKEASGEVGAAARRWTESLLRLASLDLDVQIFEREEELEVHHGGADAEVAIEDGGEVLRAIQHLLPRLMLSEVGETVRCRVDCNDFRELHEESLRAQALAAATEALVDGGEITLDPMHPADRRIVHLALADNELVHTESLGRGFFKRVSIRAN